LLARLDDYVKRLDAGVEASSKRYASLVSLWKKLTKLLKYPALVVIFVAGQDPGSPLGRMWTWLRRTLANPAPQAPPTDHQPRRPRPRGRARRPPPPVCPARSGPP